MFTFMILLFNYFAMKIVADHAKQDKSNEPSTYSGNGCLIMISIPFDVVVFYLLLYVFGLVPWMLQ